MILTVQCSPQVHHLPLKLSLLPCLPVRFVFAVLAGGVSDRAEARRVHLGGEEEGEAFHGAAQRAADVQDLHEDTAAVAQVGAYTHRHTHTLSHEDLHSHTDIHVGKQ